MAATLIKSAEPRECWFGAFSLFPLPAILNAYELKLERMLRPGGLLPMERSSVALHKPGERDTGRLR